MAANRRITVASTWMFDGSGADDIQVRFKYVALETADGSKGADTLCKYDPKDDVFVLDVGGEVDPMPTFASLMTNFIDDEKDNDLLDKARVERIAVVPDPVEAADLEDEEEQDEALVDVSYKNELEELEVDSAPPGFCEKYWVSESGGAGCFAQLSSDILCYLASDTETNITLEKDKIRVTGDYPMYVKDAIKRLTCLEKAFSLVASPQVENVMQTYTENDYRLQFQKHDTLPTQILVDPDATSIRNRLSQGNITLLLIFDSDNQRFIPMRNAPEAVRPFQKGRSRIWSDFQFPELGRPENNPEAPTAAPVEPPTEVESIVEPPLEPAVPIEGHPYMSDEKATLVNNWVKGAVEEAAAPNDLLALDTGAQTAKEEQPAEVKKVVGVKTRRAVVSVAQNAPLVAQPVPRPVTPPVVPENTPEDTSGDTPDVAPNLVPYGIPDDAPSHTPDNVTDDDPGDAPKIPQPSEISPSTPEKQSNEPLRRIPESQLINLTPPSGRVEENKEDLENPPLAALKPKENPSVGPSTPPQETRTEQVDETPVSVAAPEWPASFDRDAYGPPKGAGRGTARGNGRGRGAGGEIPKTPQKHRALGARGLRGRTPTRSERTTSHRLPPRLIDASFASMEVAKAGIAPMSFSQPALIPANSKIAASVSDGVSSSSNAPPMAESQEGDNKPEEIGSLLDAPISDADTEALYEKRLRNLKIDLEQEQEDKENSNRAKYVQSDAVSVRSGSGSQASTKTIYQKRLEELQEIKAKDKMQVVNEIESRDFHRTMGQKAPAPQQKGKAKANNKAKKQAVLEESWGFTLKKPKAPKEDKPSEDGTAQKEKKDKAKKPEVDPLLVNVYPLLKPILSAARYFPGPVSLEIQFGAIVIPRLPGDYNGNMFGIKDWNRFFYPSHGLAPPSTVFMNRLTTSGADVDYILDLKEGRGENAIQYFEEKPSKRDVTYEFHCKTQAGPIIVNVGDTGEVLVTRADAELGSVNLHFPSQTWDARLVVSSQSEYVSTETDIDRAIQMLVDDLYVPPNKARAKMFTRTPASKELEISKVLLKRTTRHRCIFAAKTDDEKVDSTSVEIPAPEAGENEDKFFDCIDEADDLIAEEPGVFLQITEAQQLYHQQLPDNRHRFRAKPPEFMVDNHLLWYEISIMSSSVEDILLSNKDLKPGKSAAPWDESELLGKDAHIDTEQSPPRDDPHPHPEETDQPDSIGETGLGGMLRTASRLISRLDGVGYWNQAPTDIGNFENPIGLMLTTAAENVKPSATASAVGGAGAAGPVGSGSGGATGGGVPAKGPAVLVEVQAENDGGVKDMDSASVRAGMNPGSMEFW
ncbi:hypothetical protein FQN54_003411 [Arachnomyces sp. PD_36]|nr:hypothetical protein FQN54_003411 [Arachnomyces sp. PD_36]